VNCAVAQPGSGPHALLMMDKIKQPRAVVKELEKQCADMKNPRWGTVSVDTDENPRLAVFQLNKPAPGMARRLVKTLKGTGFSKVQVRFEDGSPDEADEDEEDEAPPAAAAAATPPQAAAPAAAAPPGADGSAAQAGADAGQADAARQAALTKRLTVVTKKIAQGGADPARQQAMVAAANAGHARLKSGDLDGAEKLVDGLEEAVAKSAPASGAAEAASEAPDLFPAQTLQNIANKPAAKPAAPSGPPDGALARAGDGRKFWRQADAGGGAQPVASKDWLEALLRFYRAGPPKPADPNGMNCSFNGATVTIAAALDVVDAQAALGGYKPSRPTAGGILQDLLKEAAESQTLGDQIAGDAAGQGDLGADVAKLEALPMTKLLGVLDRMKEQKKLEPFVDRLTKVSDRLGAAIETVRGEFEDIQWQQLVPKLNADDRAAVVMRAPAKIHQITPGPAKAGDKEAPLIDADAVGAVGKGGVEMQVKLTAHSPLGGNVGETEFTVHIGPDGKINQFELDVTALQKSLLNKGAVAEVTATISGNATVDMAAGGSQVAPAGINAQVKAELAARLTRVKILQGVTVKLTGTYGTGGAGATLGLEFKIPGT
jgi:hypothetical protein